jgi:serine/threonine protein kinase
MCFENNRCQAWISLESLGLPYQGCLKNSSWLSSIKVPIHQTGPHTYIDLPYRKLVSLKTVSSGAFGHIDLGRHEWSDTKEEVFIKRPILSGRTLLYEACIQKLVSESLFHVGFPTGAPKPLCIFQLHDHSIGFAMEQIHGAITLDSYLSSIPPSFLSNVIIDCLLQLCAMIWHLNSTLGINHRDLKPSNFLIVVHDVPIRRLLRVEKECLEVDSKHSLTFIDFGFSCLGSTETHVSDISLSTVYSKSDPCPKEGRDMYLFLAFLYIDYHSKLPTQLLSLFEQWLDIPGSNLCHFMKKDKENSKKWLYFITGNESITSFRSCPIKIIKDLQHFMKTS